MKLGMENTITNDRHVLICIGVHDDAISADLKYDFLGIVFCALHDKALAFLKTIPRVIYLAGDIERIYKDIQNVPYEKIYIIREISYNLNVFPVISIGQVPRDVQGLGVFFPRFFPDSEKDYFQSITEEHQFQSLTESNKPGNAFRKGIYLSRVQSINGGGGDVQFNLLRCSSNLNGPTDNFRATDHTIITELNNACETLFETKTEFNHVLAQVYENQGNRKAKIKAHSDKTKDMPKNGLIAFCTFYKFDAEMKELCPSKTDPYDYCYHSTSALTRLHFRLKRSVTEDDHWKALPMQFTVTLYPNSVFIIPLSTNRLYTHEIKPSVLPADKIPTRLGYVVRCSKTTAIHRDDDHRTYIQDQDQADTLHPLVPITDSDRIRLRDLYYEENTYHEPVDYGDIYFSMNEGDYKKPHESVSPTLSV